MDVPRGGATYNDLPQLTIPFAAESFILTVQVKSGNYGVTKTLYRRNPQRVGFFFGKAESNFAFHWLIAAVKLRRRHPLTEARTSSSPSPEAVSAPRGCAYPGKYLSINESNKGE